MGLEKFHLLEKAKQNRVTIIMPVKVEPYAKVMVAQIHEILDGCEHEVLLQTEDGISNAVSQGISRAKGDYVVILDSDGSHDPKHIPDMLGALDNNGVDIVVASRRWNSYPLHRRILSLACAWLTRNFLGLDLEDPLTAYIAGKHGCMNFKSPEGCKFALEILARTPRSRIRELPISHVPKKGHKSKLKPMEGIYLARQLLRLKIGR